MAPRKPPVGLSWWQWRRGLAAGGAWLAVVHGARAEGPLVDPTVRGARLVPAEVPLAERRGGAVFSPSHGAPSGITVVPGLEPGGGVRALAAGLRIVVRADGGVLTAAAPFAEAPALALSLPARLGGGFLFVVGSVIHRADAWLGPATAIVNSASGIKVLIAGLDRVYARAPSGTYQAFDPLTGGSRDLGAFPDGPFVRGYAAADGWRAVALVDLRGPVATLDAGATWRPLDLPIDAHDVHQAGDALVIEGDDASRARRAFVLDARGEVSEVLPSTTSSEALDPSRASRPSKAPSAAAPGERGILHEETSQPLGGRPLEAAIEDGWPLGDGTAVVARDGALFRVRLADGTVAARDDTASSLGPSRCHPIALAPADALVSATARARVGFVCGVPNGATILYAYEADAAHPASAGRLVEERRWGSPRLVLPSPLGGVAVRGGCGNDQGAQAFCVRRAGGLWREARVASRGTTDARVASFPDGRLAIVTPPHDGHEAELVVRGDEGERVVPIVWPPLDDDRKAALKEGTWMEGFEARGPGEAGAGDKVGGWVDTFGTRLGVEIALDGHARVGPLVRDLGAPVVSGAFGLGFSASRRAYETTDGGLTWSPFEVPEPLAGGRRVTRRGCGPVGCNASGWLRVGWGAAPADAHAAPAPAVHFPLSRNNVALSLACAEVASEPRLAPPPLASPGVAPSPRAAPIVVGGPALAPAPALRARPLVIEVDALVDRAARLGPAARVRGAAGRRPGGAPTWQVEWSGVLGAAATRHSEETPAPGWLADLVQPSAQTMSAGVPAGIPLVNLAPGDDVDHALITVRHGLHAEPEVYALESGRAPTALRRADGGPFGELGAALRAGGRWYLAGSGETSTPAATVVFGVEGAEATELARVPRVAIEGRGIPGGGSGGVRLGQRHHGQEIDLVVDGAATSERVGATRWALGIDRATGHVGPPVSLGSSDLGDRAEVPLCDEAARADGNALVLDAPLATPLVVAVGAGASRTLELEDWGPLQAAFARVRLDASAPAGSPRACLETVSGVGDRTAGPATAVHPADGGTTSNAGGPAKAEATLVVLAGSRRTLLRCARR